MKDIFIEGLVPLTFSIRLCSHARKTEGKGLTGKYFCVIHCHFAFFYPICLLFAHGGDETHVTGTF